MRELPEREWDEADRPRKKSWWGRNWVWVVPVGCLTPVVLCTGLIVLVVSLVFGVIKSTDVYKDAIAKAQANKEVQVALGTPIQEGFFVTGNIEVNGANGNANLAIPISGPNGSATIWAVAQKRGGGRWTFSTLEVAVERDHKRIDLLAKE